MRFLENIFGRFEPLKPISSGGGVGCQQPPVKKFQIGIIFFNLNLRPWLPELIDIFMEKNLTENSAKIKFVNTTRNGYDYSCLTRPRLPAVSDISGVHLQLLFYWKFFWGLCKFCYL